MQQLLLFIVIRFEIPGEIAVKKFDGIGVIISLALENIFDSNFLSKHKGVDSPVCIFEVRPRIGESHEGEEAVIVLEEGLTQQRDFGKVEALTEGDLKGDKGREAHRGKKPVSKLV